MRGNSPSGIDAGKESDCSRPEGFYARLIKKPLPEFCYFFANFFTQEGTKTGKFFSGLFARACSAKVSMVKEEGRQEEKSQVR